MLLAGFAGRHLTRVLRQRSSCWALALICAIEGRCAGSCVRHALTSSRTGCATAAGSGHCTAPFIIARERLPPASLSTRSNGETWQMTWNRVSVSMHCATKTSLQCCSFVSDSSHLTQHEEQNLPADHRKQVSHRNNKVSMQETASIFKSLASQRRCQKCVYTHASRAPDVACTEIQLTPRRNVPQLHGTVRR